MGTLRATISQRNIHPPPLIVCGCYPGCARLVTWQLGEGGHPSQLGISRVDLLARQARHALGAELLDVERGKHRAVRHRPSQWGLVRQRLRAERRHVAEEPASERVARAG